MKNDTQLRQDVQDELQWDPLLSDIAAQIGVRSRDGVITLSGTVDSYIKKHAAETAAQRVRGVNFVAVDLEVSLGEKQKTDDTRIAGAIKELLRFLSIVDRDALSVKVDDGIVTLNGTVQWNYQRENVEEYIRAIAGVRAVYNNIELSACVCDSNTIVEKINAAFHRHAAIDATRIHVELHGNKVVLSGKVRSWIEKKDAEKVAWSSPGINSVDNQIEVSNPYIT
jgi:osmotically-inducible protein OsmY